MHRHSLENRIPSLSSTPQPKRLVRSVPGYLALACVPLLCASVRSAGAEAPSRLVVGEYEFENPTLVSMNLDGSGAIELFEPTASDWLLVGLEFDASDHGFYWTHGSTPGTVRMAAPDGSDEQVVVGGLKLPRGLSLDRSAQKLYWSAAQPTGNALGLIQRVNTDGTGFEDFFVLTPYDPSFSFVGNPTVDPTNGYVYFCAENEIVRKRTDGTGDLETVVRGVTTVRGISLDIGNGQIYFLDANTNSDYLGRCNLDDTNFTVLVDMTPGVSTSSGLWDLEVDLEGGKAYWADEIAHVVGRANLDGSDREAIYTSPTGLNPTSLTFDVNPIPPIADCNGNSIPDRNDIDSGTSLDCNGNGIPDECENDPCAAPSYVLDQGSDPETSGRTVSGDPGSAGFEVFQPFDLAETVTLERIELDGWTVTYEPGGFVATLFPDDGTGTFADESSPIEAAAFQWRFSGSTVVWVGREFSASLDPGRYWLRLTATDPSYDGVAHVGLSGLPSKSRRNSDGQIFQASQSIALRIVGDGATGIEPESPDFGDTAGQPLFADSVPLRVVPNPMRGRASIEFELSGSDRSGGNSAESPVRIEIHDVLGRVIRTLDADHDSRRMIRVEWDGTDGTGRPMASGRYYCVVEAGGRHGRAVIALVQ